MQEPDFRFCQNQPGALTKSLTHYTDYILKLRPTEKMNTYPGVEHKAPLQPTIVKRRCFVSLPNAGLLRNSYTTGVFTTWWRCHDHKTAAAEAAYSAESFEAVLRCIDSGAEGARCAATRCASCFRLLHFRTSAVRAWTRTKVSCLAFGVKENSSFASRPQNTPSDHTLQGTKSWLCFFLSLFATLSSCTLRRPCTVRCSRGCFCVILHNSCGCDSIRTFPLLQGKCTSVQGQRPRKRRHSRQPKLKRRR